MAAAVHPKPETSENAALPERFVFSKIPSVAKARAEVTPLSSKNAKNRYSTAICGMKEITLPAPPKTPSESRETAASLLIFEVINAPKLSISPSTSPFK